MFPFIQLPLFFISFVNLNLDLVLIIQLSSFFYLLVVILWIRTLDYKFLDSPYHSASYLVNIFLFLWHNSYLMICPWVLSFNLWLPTIDFFFKKMNHISCSYLGSLQWHIRNFSTFTSVFVLHLSHGWSLDKVFFFNLSLLHFFLSLRKIGFYQVLLLLFNLTLSLIMQP